MPGTDADVLHDLGEHYAAGYFELPDAAPVRRWSRALRRRLEHCTLPPYDGAALAPCGRRVPPGADEDRALQFSYSFTWALDRKALEARLGNAAPAQRRALEGLRDEIEDLDRRLVVWRSPHTVGGHGYTHSIPNYGRVLREGLDAHAARVNAGLNAAWGRRDAARVDFYRGLKDVLVGVRRWHERILAQLARWVPEDEAGGRRRDRLQAALRQTPFGPARSFYEALVAYNLIYYLDGCDNPGRLDRELDPFYQRDLQAGEITEPEALELLTALVDNVCANTGWSAAIGGSTAEGGPAYNDVTLLCLRAVRGKFRPNFELCVRPDMPDRVWDAALDAIGSGCGQPALYNEPLYLEGLADPALGVAPQDRVWWNGGGCTETMIHGCSNVGSLDAGINLSQVLDGALRRALPTAPTFDALLAAYKADVDLTVARVAEGVSRLQEAKSRLRPQPVRSLLIDDCIARGIEYNAGGARYNWSGINLAGLPNVVDSLAAVRELVYEEGEVSGPELLLALERDWEGAERLRERAARCPRYGNDNPRADELAADLADHVFSSLRAHRPWRGGRYLPACIQFTTYARAGGPVGATPDGRRAGEPLADSIGPVAGRDRQGPTAMLRSVTRLPLRLALCTPVLNARLNADLFGSASGRRAVRDLVEAYFDMGGMQIQLSVVDQEVLRDAIAHPEAHEDLIVRVGGFSAYFNTLSEELKWTLLQRTEHVLA